MKDSAVSIDLDWPSYSIQLSQRAAQVMNCILSASQYICLENYRKAFVAYCRSPLAY